MIDFIEILFRTTQKSHESKQFMSQKTAYLSQIEILKDLSPAQLDDVDSDTHLFNYSAEHLFYMPEDEGEVLFILKQGRVQLYRISPDGRKLVFAVLNPGAIFGHMALIGQGLHQTYAQALDDVTICIWNREKVEAALKSNPEMALRFLAAVGDRLTQTEERLADITFKRLPARLAILLLQLCDEHKTCDLTGYTHQHLADMLGVYRETITQLLNGWKNAKLIELGRKRIRIVDAATLEEYGQAE
jgi:CRP/FNR family transcriptional regulator, cyclic AMP receptor protein